jgi:hypothetical protein
MTRPCLYLAALAAAAAAAACGQDVTVGDRPDTIEPWTEPGDCGLDVPAFCDPFDAPSPGGRGGDIDEAKWSFAHWGFAGQFITFGRGVAHSYNQGYDETGTLVVDTTPSNPVPTFCGAEFTGIEPPGDVRICDGVDAAGNPSRQLHEVFNTDALPVNSMRIRQPFDFTGRTGTVVFEVDAKRNDGWDGHGWWLELWITEATAPIPYHGAPTIEAPPRGRAVGLQILPDGDCFGDPTRNAIGRLVLTDDYRVLSDDNEVTSECFNVADTRLNRFEVRISETSLEVSVSDADRPGEMRRILTLADVDIGFSYGYVHLQHVHYNPPKTPNADGLFASASQTFRWDNIGFDGPTYPTPRGYDVPDQHVPLTISRCPTCDDRVHAGVQLGYALEPGGAARRFELPGVDLSDALGATLNFDFSGSNGTPIDYRWNGGDWTTFEYPGTSTADLMRAISIDVSLDELVAGTNVLEIASPPGGPISIGNIDLTVDVR